MAYANPFGGGTDAFAKWLGLLQQDGVEWQQYNSDPQLLYGAYANIVGSYGSHSFMDWLNKHGQDFLNQYTALSASDPTYMFTDYLKKLNPAKEYSFSSPYDRGDRPGDFAPNMRMVT